VEVNIVAHTVDVIKKFCELCDELFSVWQLRKYLYDENPLSSYLKGPRHQHFFLLLQNILQESWIHKLTKLHDPAAQNAAINLSIPYIVEYGNWHPDVKSRLTKLQGDMDPLSKALRSARNKTLAHNDLTVILAESTLGEFDAGQDDLYFRALKEFSSVSCQVVVGTNFHYTDLVQNDVEIFMHDFVKGIKISVA
jgi:hypothetical protein